MRVEPLRQDPVPVVAQGEPDEREHVKVEPGDEYFLYERGRIILLGLSRLRDFVFFHSRINNKLANLGALWGVHPIAETHLFRNTQTTSGLRARVVSSGRKKTAVRFRACGRLSESFSSGQVRLGVFRLV